MVACPVGSSSSLLIPKSDNLPHQVILSEVVRKIVAWLANVSKETGRSRGHDIGPFRGRSAEMFGPFVYDAWKGLPDF